MSTDKKLPTLAELHNDIEMAKKMDKFKTLMYQPPAEKWLKKHPFATFKNEKGEVTKAKYIQIDKIEFMLDAIFQEWYPEVRETGVMFNSVYVTLRLHLKHPLTGEWFYIDGVGAKDVQTDAGATAADLSKIKPSAVMMALPSAKSYALKDAAEHLGPLFGRDMNRKDNIMFAGKYTDKDEKEPFPTLNNPIKEPAPAAVQTPVQESDFVL